MGDMDSSRGAAASPSPALARNAARLTITPALHEIVHPALPAFSFHRQALGVTTLWPSSIPHHGSLRNFHEASRLANFQAAEESQLNDPGFSFIDLRQLVKAS